MADETDDTGPIQGSPVETVLAEVNAPPAAPQRLSDAGPLVSVSRTVSEAVPVAQLSPAQASALWEEKRTQWEQNRQLGNDAEWFRGYLALAARANGAAIDAGEIQEAVGPDGRLRAPGAGEMPPPALPEPPRAHVWDERAREALHAVAQDSRWPPHVLSDGYQLVSQLAGQPVPSADHGYTALEQRWGARADQMVDNAQYVLDLLGHDDEPAVRNAATWLAAMSNHPQVPIYLSEVVFPLLRNRPQGPLVVEMIGRRAMALKATAESGVIRRILATWASGARRRVPDPPHHPQGTSPSPPADPPPRSIRSLPLGGAAVSTPSRTCALLACPSLWCVAFPPR
jgi:hypothetical protein